MAYSKIVCIGSGLQDVYLKDKDDFSTVEFFEHSVFDKIELGAKVDIDQVFFSTGGGATNAAVTFARQGYQSFFMGMLGRDLAGQAVIGKLDEEGIDTRFVKHIAKYGTGYSVILLAPSGERTILIYRGASSRYNQLNPDDLDEIMPDWVYITTLSGDYEVLAKIFAKCAKLKTKIMFNPGLKEIEDPKKLKALLNDVDVLIVNKDEAKRIVRGESMDELLSCLKNYAGCVIISDGTNGIVASDGLSKIRAGIYEDVKSADRTGAGDAFGSGFLSQWARGKSLKDSIVFASANSSSVVSCIGAKTGILGKNAKLHSMPIDEEKL